MFEELEYRSGLLATFEKLEVCALEQEIDYKLYLAYTFCTEAIEAYYVVNL